MKTIDVVAAIIVHDGKYLATQRGYGEYKDGWEFPGGKIEARETPEEALRRDTRRVGRRYFYRQIALHSRLRLCILSSTYVMFYMPRGERRVATCRG